MLHDPQEEHNGFSENTRWSYYYDALGIENIYTDRDKRIDESLVTNRPVTSVSQTIFDLILIGNVYAELRTAMPSEYHLG